MWEQLLGSLQCPERGKKSCSCSLLYCFILSNAVQCSRDLFSLRFEFKSLAGNLRGNEP